MVVYENKGYYVGAATVPFSEGSINSSSANTICSNSICSATCELDTASYVCTSTKNNGPFLEDAINGFVTEIDFPTNVHPTNCQYEEIVDQTTTIYKTVCDSECYKLYEDKTVYCGIPISKITDLKNVAAEKQNEAKLAALNKYYTKEAALQD